MTWLRWVVVGLVVFEAGYMVFDGSRALVVGDYITPRSGRTLGQLGPWTWNLIFGTVTSVIVIALLLLPVVRSEYLN